MIFSKLLLSVACFSTSLALAACNAGDREPFTYAQSQRQSLPSFAQTKSRKGFTLLIGLKPYLGQATLDRKGFKEFTLLSAGKSLVLKDSGGIEHKSSEIKLFWRQIPLLNPVKVKR